MTAAAPRFKKIRNVTLPLLKLEENVPYYLKMTGAMFPGKQIDDKKAPATLAHCINLETGEECQIIVAAVLKGIFTEEYPNDAYIGKCFEVVKHRLLSAETGDLKYNTFTLAEVAEPDEADDTTQGDNGAHNPGHGDVDPGTKVKVKAKK